MPGSIQDDLQNNVKLDVDDTSVCSDAIPTKTDSRSSDTQKRMYGRNGLVFKLSTRDMTQEIKAILNKMDDSPSPANSISDADLTQGLSINAFGSPVKSLKCSINLRSSTSRTA